MLIDVSSWFKLTLIHDTVIPKTVQMYNLWLYSVAVKSRHSSNSHSSTAGWLIFGYTHWCLVRVQAHTHPPSSYTVYSYNPNRRALKLHPVAIKSLRRSNSPLSTHRAVVVRSPHTSLTEVLSMHCDWQRLFTAPRKSKTIVLRLEIFSSCSLQLGVQPLKDAAARRHLEVCSEHALRRE